MTHNKAAIRAAIEYLQPIADNAQLPGYAKALNVALDTMREATADAAVQVKADIHTQRAMWLMCVAMNDAFGIGPERFKQFAACLQDRSDWYEDLKNGADEEYANEKLRQEASRCSGTEIEYLYEAEMRGVGEVVG